MSSRLRFLILACVVLAVLAWLLLPRVMGPTLRAYEVIEQPMVQTVVATGRVAALSRAQVGSEVTGVVIERRVREGDKVQPGDVLAILRADDLEAAVNEAEAALAELQQSTRPQAAAALREAQATLEQARRETQRRRALFERRAISQEEMERAVQSEATARAAAERAQLEAQALGSGNPNEAVARARVASARAQLDKTTIRATVAGTVLTRNAEPGDLVQPSRVLFEIARDGDTELLVSFDERNLEVLALDQSAMGIADAYPASPFVATVNYIAPSVDRERGTVDVRLSVQPAPAFLREDMTVSVNVETGRRERALVLPNDALSAVNGNQAQLWLVVNGRTERRQVTLGMRGLTQTEISAGLQAGDVVIADTAAVKGAGERVRVKFDDVSGAEADSATRNELPVSLD